MSEDDPNGRELEDLLEDMRDEERTQTTIIRVDKRTHRIRFDKETADSVRVVIEPHGGSAN